MAGLCAAVPRALLTPSSHPGSANTLKLIAEQEALPWQVRLHDRSTMLYQAHLAVAERGKKPANASTFLGVWREKPRWRARTKDLPWRWIAESQPRALATE